MESFYRKQRKPAVQEGKTVILNPDGKVGNICFVPSPASKISTKGPPEMYYRALTKLQRMQRIIFPDEDPLNSFSFETTPDSSNSSKGRPPPLTISKDIRTAPSPRKSVNYDRSMVLGEDNISSELISETEQKALELYQRMRRGLAAVDHAKQFQERRKRELSVGPSRRYTRAKSKVLEQIFDPRKSQGVRSPSLSMAGSLSTPEGESARTSNVAFSHPQAMSLSKMASGGVSHCCDASTPFKEMCSFLPVYRDCLATRQKRHRYDRISGMTRKTVLYRVYVGNSTLYQDHLLTTISVADLQEQLSQCLVICNDADGKLYRGLFKVNQMFYYEDPEWEPMDEDSYVVIPEEDLCILYAAVGPK